MGETSQPYRAYISRENPPMLLWLLLLLLTKRRGAAPIIGLTPLRAGLGVPGSGSSSDHSAYPPRNKKPISKFKDIENR